MYPHRRRRRATDPLQTGRGYYTAVSHAQERRHLLVEARVAFVSKATARNRCSLPGRHDFATSATQTATPLRRPSTNARPAPVCCCCGWRCPMIPSVEVESGDVTVNSQVSPTEQAAIDQALELIYAENRRLSDLL